MSGNKFLLDTNIVLYLLGGKIEINNLPEGEFILSFINELELLSYPEINKTEEEKIENFIKDIEVIGYDDDIKENTIRLRKEFKLKLPDAIVCATAYLNKASLITHDSHLAKIKELKIINPVFKS